MFGSSTVKFCRCSGDAFVSKFVYCFEKLDGATTEWERNCRKITVEERDVSVE